MVEGVIVKQSVYIYSIRHCQPTVYFLCMLDVIY